MENELRDFPKQCRYAASLENNIKINDINKIVIVGVGGSAFPADVLNALCEDEVDIFANRDYNIIGKANKNTLVFVVSYSGNTEEAISSFDDALKKGCNIIGIFSGGILETKCKENGIDFIKVPSGIEPRNALGYLLIPIINILTKNKIISDKGIDVMLNDIDNPAIEVEGKRIANILFNKIPIIYSSRKFGCVSYGWKTRLNENSKIPVFSNVFPELNHNEINGYVRNTENFHVIMIEDDNDHPRIKKRFSVTKDIIEKNNVKCTSLKTIGSNMVSKIFCTLYIANWVSYYLALKYGIDPKPVSVIEDLKKKLS